MRRTHRTDLVVGLLLALLATGCLDTGERDDSVDVASWAERQERRAFDGAPPVIPHDALGASCISCHGDRTVALPDGRMAPASPHAGTPGVSNQSRCRQCHVFQVEGGLFRATEFVPFRRAGVVGERLFDGAPPVMPHPQFMREACLSCHAGPGSRVEVRTTHPERVRCTQCHVAAVAVGEFVSPFSSTATSESVGADHD